MLSSAIILWKYMEKLHYQYNNNFSCFQQSQNHLTFPMLPEESPLLTYVTQEQKEQHDKSIILKNIINIERNKNWFNILFFSEKDHSFDFNLIEEIKLLYQILWEPIKSCPWFAHFDQFELKKTFVEFYLPLASKIKYRQELSGKPYIQSVVGCQGAGKTTLTKTLQFILNSLQIPTISFSLDDFYLTHQEREELKKKYTYLQFRGPPGTHNVEELYKTLNLLKKNQKAKIPSFDKSLHNGSGDVIGFNEIENASVILFEGWMNGYSSLKIEDLEEVFALNSEVYKKNSDELSLALFSNENLNQYEKIWELCDDFIVIKPEKWDYVYLWRAEAEELLRKNSNGGGYSNETIYKFVKYFQISLNPDAYFNKMVWNRNMQNKLSALFILDKNRKLIQLTKKLLDNRFSNVDLFHYSNNKKYAFLPTKFIILTLNNHAQCYGEGYIKVLSFFIFLNLKSVNTIFSVDFSVEIEPVFCFISNQINFKIIQIYFFILLDC